MNPLKRTMEEGVLVLGVNQRPSTVGKPRPTPKPSKKRGLADLDLAVDAIHG